MLVAFFHLYPRNKVEIRSEHYEYQATEVRLKQSILIVAGVAYSITISLTHYSVYVNIYRQTQGTEGLQHCCFKFRIDICNFLS